MKIGVCKQCISTELPIHLTGFGNPNRKFTGVHDDIYASAMVVEEAEKKIAIVTADVLGFDRKRLTYIRSYIEEKCGIPANAILFNASHTHSAPQVLLDCNPGLGEYLAEYAEEFYATITDIICKANDDLEEGELYSGETECYGIGINRRKIVDGKCQFAPYEDGIRNDEVSVIKAVCGGKVKAVLFQCICHPSTTGFDEISADYPGAARKVIEESLPGAKAIFMQGCCGNIRIRTIAEDGLRFSGGSYEAVQKFGTKLANAVLSVTNGEMSPIGGGLDHKMENFMIALQPKDELASYKKQLAEEKSIFNRRGLEYYVNNYNLIPEKLPYSVQRIDLGNALTFIALEGEVCVEYDHNMKALLPDRHVITAGYSNGMPGYICAEDMYPQGGYEPDGSAMVYLIANGFDPKTEQVILSYAKKLA